MLPCSRFIMNKAINFLIDIDHFCEILHWDSVILSYPFFMSIRECRFCWAIFSQIFLQTRTKVEFLAFINGWVQIGQFYFPIQQISLLFARQVLEHRAFCQELIYSLIPSVFFHTNLFKNLQEPLNWHPNLPIEA